MRDLYCPASEPGNSHFEKVRPDLRTQPVSRPSKDAQNWETQVQLPWLGINTVQVLRSSEAMVIRAKTHEEFLFLRLSCDGRVCYAISTCNFQFQTWSLGFERNFRDKKQDKSIFLPHSLLLAHSNPSYWPAKAKGDKGSRNESLVRQTLQTDFLLFPFLWTTASWKGHLHLNKPWKLSSCHTWKLWTTVMCLDCFLPLA